MKGDGTPWICPGLQNSPILFPINPDQQTTTRSAQGGDPPVQFPGSLLVEVADGGAGKKYDPQIF